ncbi:MAG TPA: MMPL family transporter [Acidiferrobacter sp.]|nr:MMPL family transporter [Acidiferrobacter sp.]
MAALLVGLAKEARWGGSLTAFLPQSGSIVQRALVLGLHKGDASRLLLLSVEGGTADARIQASRALARALGRHRNRFALVANGGRQTSSGSARFLFRNRYLLAPRTSWSTASLRADLKRDLAFLESPAGLGGAHLLADPTGAFLTAAKPWLGVSGPPTQRGVWVSPDRSAALLLVETRQSGFAVAAQRQALAIIQAAFREVARGTALTLRLGGTGAITVAANDRVARSAKMLTIIDTLLIAAILLAVYRSWRPIMASLVPLVTGAVTATVAAALIFPDVTVTTLGFGTMLIGVAMDYPAYVLLHTGPKESVAQAARRVAPALGLAMTAMVIGFSTMLVSDLSGLVQLGVFAIVGLVAAALAARFLLPLMVPVWTQGSALARWDRRARNLVRMFRRQAWLVIVLSVMALLVLWMDAAHIWDNHLSALSPASPTLMAQTGALAREFGVPGLSSLLVVVGPDRQTVLQRSMDLKPTLVRLRKAGQIAGFDMAARYLPTVARQNLRKSALPKWAVLRNRLIVASRGLPFRQQAFRPFLDAVQEARHAHPLQFADLPRAMRTKMGALLMRVHGKAVAFVRLTGVRHPNQVARAVAHSGVTGAHFVVVKAEIAGLLAHYRNALLRHSLMAGLLMAVVLGFGLRSLAGALRLLVPMGAAILVTCGILVMIGPGLTLLNVVALLLIAGLGMGYALFLGDNGLIVGRQALAPWVCAATTITGFGVMAFAPVRLLQSVGLTVSIGALLALVFTAAWSRSDDDTGLRD